MESKVIVPDTQIRRRGLLLGMLALGVAPAIVRGTSLMPIAVPRVRSERAIVYLDKDGMTFMSSDYVLWVDTLNRTVLQRVNDTWVPLGSAGFPIQGEVATTWQIQKTRVPYA